MNTKSSRFNQQGRFQFELLLELKKARASTPIEYMVPIHTSNLQTWTKFNLLISTQNYKELR